MLSPHLRVAGLKVFTDFDNATIMLWRQAELDAFLLARYQAGWPIAIKTVSTRSLAMILKALRAAREVDGQASIDGTRLEHMLFATPQQIAGVANLGLVPVINLNNPGQIVGRRGRPRADRERTRPIVRALAQPLRGRCAGGRHVRLAELPTSTSPPGRRSGRRCT